MRIVVDLRKVRFDTKLGAAPWAMRVSCLLGFAMPACVQRRDKYTQYCETIDSGLGEGYYKSRRCSRDTCPETHTTKYTSI